MSTVRLVEDRLPPCPGFESSPGATVVASAARPGECPDGPALRSPLRSLGHVWLLSLRSRRLACARVRAWTVLGGAICCSRQSSLRAANCSLVATGRRGRLRRRLARNLFEARRSARGAPAASLPGCASGWAAPSAKMKDRFIRPCSLYELPTERPPPSRGAFVVLGA